MAKKRNPEKKVFIDTSAIIAFFSERENHYSEAQSVFQFLQRNKYEIFVSNYVVSETHARFLNSSKIRDQRQRIRSALQVLAALHDKSQYKVLFVDETVEEEARQRLPTYPDKQWSLTDMTSFLLMSDQPITYYFSFDSDFAQASGSFPILDILPLIPSK